MQGTLIHDPTPAPPLPAIDAWQALSLLQPWCGAILDGGKRLENRDWKHGSNFRGWFMLHASKKLTRKYYDGVVDFVSERSSIKWRPPPFAEVRCGGIVGIARVRGVVHNESDIEHPDFGIAYGQTPWWMGGFALVLDDVRSTPFVPCAGALSFWRVPVDVARLALAEAA